MNRFDVLAAPAKTCVAYQNIKGDNRREIIREKVKVE